MKNLSTAFNLAVLLIVAATSHAEEIVTLSARDGPTQSFLLTVPGNGAPAAAAILFPGGNGLIRLRNEGGRIRFGEGNFLVRTRQMFVERGIVTAVVDAPSDRLQGMNDEFRFGDKHAADMKRVSEELKRRFPGVPVFLVGTSRGTISASAIGGTPGEGITGVVLTSTLTLSGGNQGPGLSKFDYSRIKIPVLLVHHAEDGCFVSPYSEARKLAETRKYPLITVNGGKPPTSEPCEAFSTHGYLGKEKETVEAIVNWMLQKPYSTNIE